MDCGIGHRMAEFGLDRQFRRQINDIKESIVDANLLNSLRQAFDGTNPETKLQAPNAPEQSPSAIDPLGTSVPQIDRVGNGPFELIEFILKFPNRLDQLIRQPEYQIALIPRFLAISLIGFTLFGVAMSLVLSAASVWPQLFPMEAVLAGSARTPLLFLDTAADSFLKHWLNGDAFRLIIAYAVGLIAATGICLPSLYFYGLLAGVRMTMTDVVIHALKSKAVAAVMLIGILPIYAAIGLGIAIFHFPDPIRDFMLLVGLGLPFVAGFAGTFSLYRGLSTLTDTMSADRRPYRECFLQRLVLSWAGCYSAVSPVLIFTLWQQMQS